MIPSLAQCWINNRSILTQYFNTYVGSLTPDVPPLILNHNTLPTSVHFNEADQSPEWSIFANGDRMRFIDESNNLEFMSLFRNQERLRLRGTLRSTNITTGGHNFDIASEVENERLFRFDTSQIPRFSLRITPAPESGSDVGSNFQLIRYDDSGSALTPNSIQMNRAVGSATLGDVPLGFFGTTPGTKPTVTGSRAGVGVGGALNQLLNHLQTLGLLTNSTT